MADPSSRNEAAKSLGLEAVATAPYDDSADARRDECPRGTSRLALIRLLSSADFSASAFSSARAFLNEVDRSAVSYIVVDLHMPEMNGIDLQHHLRRACPRLASRVIIITARMTIRGYANAASLPAPWIVCASPSKAPR
jgi:hypothetical protein